MSKNHLNTRLFCTADAMSTEEPNDQAVIPLAKANTMGKELLNEAQSPITVDQITSIVLVIDESKLATF